MYRLPNASLPLNFPDDFETTPEGLLAIGGNLHPETLLNAYAKGLFPWFSQDDPILWWHPHPRMVLYPENLHISKNMRRLTNRLTPKSNTKAENFQKIPLFSMTINNAFEEVIQECAHKRGPGRESTWLNLELIKSFSELHRHGFAHSVEVWQNQKLVGGLYGLTLGRVFFGESMFSHVNNASKLAMIHLCETLQNQDWIIDCQVASSHLESLGAIEITQEAFLKELVGKGAWFKNHINPFKHKD